MSQDKKAQVEELRKIIKSASPGLEEHIKWNAPSYIHKGEDRITFNLLNKEGLVKLILHMGASRKEDKKAKPIMNDATGLIEWNSDIRGMILFRGIQDIRTKEESFTKIIKQWLAFDH